MQLAQAAAVVTGGASGLGEATTRALTGVTRRPSQRWNDVLKAAPNTWSATSGAT